MANVLTDANQLDWAAALKAAERIVRVCQDAGFTAPEALGVLQGKVSQVCEQLNTIVVALKITPPTPR